MFDRTVTLFNYRKKDGKWYSTVFRNCSLNTQNSLSKTTMGVTNASSMNINFRCDKEKNMRNEGVKKKFYTPKEYQELSSVSKAITFTPEVDFMIIGEVKVNGVSENDYESGFYHYMNDEYDEVYMVTNYALYTLLPHLSVGGK